MPVPCQSQVSRRFLPTRGRLGLMLGLFVAGLLPAQEPDTDPLQALLTTPISVASSKPMNLRESPGIVSCVTREEIQASGARDLIDVLRLIPGFDVAYDNSGATGLSVRGLWAFEGKALFLWNGIEMPELLTGTTAVGHRFPVDQIRRIEVIRGPGSAKYGGGAELAVVRITTLEADRMDGPAVGVMVGSGSGYLLRRAVHGLFVRRFDSGLELNVGVYDDRGRRSAEPWLDNAGNARHAADNSEMVSRFLHFGLKWKGLDLHGLLDDYKLQDPIYLPTQPQQWFESYSQNIHVSWVLPLADGLRLTPSFAYRRDSPNHRIVRPKDNPLSRTVLRLQEGLRLDWDLTKALNVSLGVEHFEDRASTGADTSASYYLGPNKARFADYRDDAVFGELGFRGAVNLLLGARWEKHDAAGSAFVPRVALTKAFEHLHFKLLYAGAFRTPNVLHFRTTSVEHPPIEPERTRTLEAEMGWRFRSQSVSLNLYRTRLDKPIVDTGPVSINGPQIGSLGGEIDYKCRAMWGLLDLSYARYQIQDNEVAKWTVPGHPDASFGVAPHKVSGLARVLLGREFSLDPSFVWLSSRHGWIRQLDNRRGGYERFPSALLANLQLVWSREKLAVSLGGFDLLNRAPGFIQAYANQMVPLPDGGRELVLKARWGF